MKKITIEFELLEGAYRLITDDPCLDGIVFDVEDLTEKHKAEETQQALEYIFYRKRSEFNSRKLEN